MRKFGVALRVDPERTEPPDLTQNQLHDLLETESARTLVEGAEERGFIEPAELEAFALEHDSTTTRSSS